MVVKQMAIWYQGVRFTAIKSQNNRSFIEIEHNILIADCKARCNES